MDSQKQNRIYGGVKADLRKKDRRDKLLSAALETFGTKGYAGNSVKNICQIAGLTERYFYESFKNKEDLLCSAYQQLIGELKKDSLFILNNKGDAYEEASYDVLINFFQWFENDPRKAKLIFFEVLGVSDRVDKVYRAGLVTLREIIDYILMKASPEIDISDQNNRLITTGLAGALIHIAHVWALDGFNLSIDDIVPQAVKIFTAIRQMMQT